MDVKVANRLLALDRQRAVVKASIRRGVLTPEEAAPLFDKIDLEIAAIRGQGSIALVPSDERK